MTDNRENNHTESFNQSESDDTGWLENKIKEQLQQNSNDENGDSESSVMSQHSYSQGEECSYGFGGFGNPFFNPPNCGSFRESQPALPPGLSSADQGFSKEPFAKNKSEPQEYPLLQFLGPVDAGELFKIPQKQMPKHSRFSHFEQEPAKGSLKSRLKLVSASFKPVFDAAPQEEFQNEENGEIEEDEENNETVDFENKIQSKEILEEPPEPENQEKNETPTQDKHNPYAGKILTKREIEERKRKKAAEAEAEVAALKPKPSSEVVIIHKKATDETPQIEHKNEKPEPSHSSKNTIETPKNSQNKTPKSQDKHHENNGIAKQQSFKKEDSFKQAPKHKKRPSIQQEKEIVLEYVEKKNPKPHKEDIIETKPKLAGVNKFNKFEFLIENEASASENSDDSIEENLVVKVKKGSNSPKKPESKSVIPEKDNDQQGSNKKKNKKKKNKNKALASNKDLDHLYVAPKEIKEIEEKVKTPSEENPPSEEEIEKPQEVKLSSKAAKNKKKKANKKKKKNASSIQALDDEKEIIKTPESALSQISEVDQEILSQNTKKKTFREICEDPTMVSSGFLFIPSSNFYDDLLKGMKIVPR